MLWASPVSFLVGRWRYREDSLKSQGTVKELSLIHILTLFLMSLAAYLVIFLSAFWDLPLNIPPWHQGLLLYFHSIPMFFLQLLLCRLAKPHWRLFAPLMLLLVPGLVFVGSAGWAVLGWVLFL